MNIIIKNEYFNSNKIKIKKKINRGKITYVLNSITVLGIPIHLENITIQQSFRNILVINCKASPTKTILAFGFPTPKTKFFRVIQTNSMPKYW